jgi:hypothetical protein
MQSAFATVLWIVCGVGILAGLVALAQSGRVWSELGASRLLRDGDLPGPSTAPMQLSDAQREEEIRQLLEARNHRRLRRGEAPLDIEAELARLCQPSPIDPQLLAEIRELVIARNHRRLRRGQPPLDVEAEIARQVAALPCTPCQTPAASSSRIS